MSISGAQGVTMPEVEGEPIAVKGGKIESSSPVPVVVSDTVPVQSTEDTMKLEDITDSIVGAFFFALLFRVSKSLYLLWTNSAKMGLYNFLDIGIFLGMCGLTYYTSFWKSVLKFKRE
jgi:hypothetical protein